MLQDIKMASKSGKGCLPILDGLDHIQIDDNYINNYINGQKRCRGAQNMSMKSFDRHCRDEKRVDAGFAGNGFYGRLNHRFQDYVADFTRSYSCGRAQFELKRDHSRQVAVESAAIARGIGLAADEVGLAQTIGLLHDIGRFPQFAEFATFNDRISVDHGDCGAMVLRSGNWLAPLDESDRQVVETAVAYHNKACLPDISDSRMRLFAQLIRDADKLDILRVIRDVFQGPDPQSMTRLPPGMDVSEQVRMAIVNHDIVAVDAVRNQIDLVFFRMGWFFDINFDITRTLLESRGYFGFLRAMLPDTARIGDALRAMDNYMGVSGIGRS